MLFYVCFRCRRVANERSRENALSKTLIGLWRAFVRVVAGGKKGKANFRSTSERYRYLLRRQPGHADLQEARRMCAAAKAKAKSLPKTRLSASYLGKRPREVRREQESRQRQATTQRMALLDASALSLQVLEMAAGNQTMAVFVKQMRAAQRAQHATAAAEDLSSISKYDCPSEDNGIGGVWCCYNQML